MGNERIEKVITFHRDLSRHFQADIAKERNILGKKIAEARKKAGITQPQLSELLTHFGVHVKTPGVNKWEKGETVPNAYQLMALCHALNIENGLDYFTGPVVPKKDVLNTEGQRLLREYREYLESKDRPFATMWLWSRCLSASWLLPPDTGITWTMRTLK